MLHHNVLKSHNITVNDYVVVHVRMLGSVHTKVTTLINNQSTVMNLTSKYMNQLAILTSHHNQ